MSTEARAIYRVLTKTYPDVRCELDFSNPLELTIATVLSAQCTDKRVNQVTPALFKKYKSVNAYAGARVEDIEDPLMQKIRYLDMVIDELAKGKAMEKILRK